MKFIDLTGRKFGRLTAIARSKGSTSSGYKWFCVCDCGNETFVLGSNLRHGHVRSCGCLVKEFHKRDKSWLLKHGMYKSPEYQAYHDMIQRCTNPESQRWDRYGSRGITVCPRWLESFENFYTDMGPRPSKNHSLDRKDNNGNYDPDNCRWATFIEQVNNKSDNRTYDLNGETLTISQIARKYNIPRGRLATRLKNGDTIENAVSPGVRYKPMHQYELDGVSKSLKEWANEYDLPYRRLWKRIHESGMSLRQALQRNY